MAAYGLLPSDVADEAFGVWPDNIPACNVFIAMDTQWRCGYSGPTGLDYSVLPTVFDLIGLPPTERADTFDCVRVMESEAMKIMGEMRD